MARGDDKYSFRLGEPMRQGKRRHVNNAFQSKSPSPSASAVAPTPKKLRPNTPPPTTPPTLTVQAHDAATPSQRSAAFIPEPEARERRRSRSPEYHRRRPEHRTEDRRRYEEPSWRHDDRDYREPHHAHYRREHRSSDDRHGFRVHDYHHRRRTSPHRSERDRDWRARDHDRDREPHARDYDKDRESMRDYERGREERDYDRRRLVDERHYSDHRAPSVPPPPQSPPPPPPLDTEISATPEPPAAASVPVRDPQAPWELFQWTPEFKVYRSIEKHFENLELIGQGTFGKVWKALMKDTGRVVALKQVTDKRNRNQLFTVPNLRELKFFSLHHHPNMLELLGVVSFDEKSAAGGEVEVNEYLVLEYMDHDLAGLMQHIPNKRLYEVQHLKCMAKQLLEGLDYMHTANVMHRDLKVANLLMSNRGELKIADFGFAREKDDLTQDGYTNRVCTIWYRPLEVILGERSYGFELDMWSAGCVLAEMFLKQPLFHTQMGLETEQATRIFSILGHPTESADWQYLKGLGWAEMLKKPARHFPRRLESYLVERSAKHIPIPPMAVDLIVKLLAFDPAKRPTAREALAHPFFTTEQPLACAPRDIPSIDGSFHEFECKERNKQKKNSNFLGTHSSRRRESGAVSQQHPDPSSQPPATPSGRRGTTPPPGNDPAITKDEHRGLWYDAKSNCVFDDKAGRWIDIMDYDRVHFPQEYWKFMQAAERDRPAAAPNAQPHPHAGPPYQQLRPQQQYRPAPGLPGGEHLPGRPHVQMHAPAAPYGHYQHPHRAASGTGPIGDERAQPLPPSGPYPHHQPQYRATPGPPAGERPSATPNSQIPPYGSYHHQQQRSTLGSGPGFQHQGPGLGYRQRELVSIESRQETPVPYRHAAPQQYRAGVPAPSAYPQQQRPTPGYPGQGYNKRTRSPASPLSPRSSRHDLSKRRRTSPSPERGRRRSRSRSMQDGHRTPDSSPSVGSPMSVSETGAEAQQRRRSPIRRSPSPPPRAAREEVDDVEIHDIADPSTEIARANETTHTASSSLDDQALVLPGDVDPRVAGELGPARLVDLRRRQPRVLDGTLELAAPNVGVWYPTVGHKFDPKRVKPYARPETGSRRGRGIVAALDVF
ncbi:Cyclin-dependent kinase 12 [Geranomyces variabilis]|uniref:Cyclin-dependent kinase 12 n=1 Tax=Geranomyces variabilis TaxID=109894 RepID=A0AAD5TEN8_9FUNG|nr:Cyclin-dependent kinase 12 [Geranomyces variabilis]